MPGSFEYQSTMIKASIKYYLTALLIIDPAPYSVSSEIRLIQAPSAYSSDLTHGCLSSNILGCCLFSQGSLLIRAKFDKSSYSLDEAMLVIIDIDSSRCSADIGFFEISLFRGILLKSHDGAQKIIKDKVAGKKVRAKRKDSLLANEGINVPIALYNLQNDLINSCTTRGKIISCSYSIQITAVMDSACASAVPEIEIWADIRPLIQKTQHPKPKKWRPAIMPPVKIEPTAPPLE